MNRQCLSCPQFFNCIHFRIKHLLIIQFLSSSSHLYKDLFIFSIFTFILFFCDSIYRLYNLFLWTLLSLNPGVIHILSLLFFLDCFTSLNFFSNSCCSMLLKVLKATFVSVSLYTMFQSISFRSFINLFLFASVNNRINGLYFSATIFLLISIV